MNEETKKWFEKLRTQIRELDKTAEDLRVASHMARLDGDSADEIDDYRISTLCNGVYLIKAMAFDIDIQQRREEVQKRTMERKYE